MKVIKEYWPYIAALFILILFVRLADFNGLYGQDSYEYLRYTRCLNAFVKTGTNPGDYFWPLLYPITGAVLSFVVPLPFALQLISIVSFVLTAIYVEKLILLMYDAEKKVIRPFIFLFLVLSPYLWRSGFVVMSDSMSIFFITAAWYYCFAYKKTLLGKYFLAFVFFSTAAIATRYAAFIVLVIPSISFLIVFARNIRWINLLIAIGIIIALFIPHFLIRSHSPFGFIHHEWLQTWSPLNFFHNHFITDDGNATYPFYNIIYAVFNFGHPAFCFAGLVFGALWLFKIKANIKTNGVVLMILSIILYAGFLAGIPFQNMRFLLLSFPLVIVVLFGGYNSLAAYFTNKSGLKYSLLVIVGVIQIGLCYRVFKPFCNDNKEERQIATEMLKYDKDTLYTFSIDGALKAYGYNGVIMNMWSARYDTAHHYIRNAEILFNESQFADEWKNQNPMINWEYLNKNYVVRPIKQLPDGWTLYSVERHQQL